MASVNPLELSVLIRVGNGTPAVLGTVDLPLKVDAVTPADNYGSLILQPDLAVLHEGLRAVLLEAAETIPAPPSPVAPVAGGVS